MFVLGLGVVFGDGEELKNPGRIERIFTSRTRRRVGRDRSKGPASDSFPASIAYTRKKVTIAGGDPSPSNGKNRT